MVMEFHDLYFPILMGLMGVAEKYPSQGFPASEFPENEVMPEVCPWLNSG